jgi:hypothetical protein
MELRIISPQEDGFLKSIDFNHVEIVQELKERLVKYQGLVYNENEIKIAKGDRAALNKFKEALELKRREIKKQCLAPYEAFELKIKQILTLVEKPALEIDKQVKLFEEKQKNEKKNIIEGVYNEAIGALTEILPLNRLWNDKWLNATYKLDLISKEIITAIEKVRSDLEVIASLGSEFDLQVKDKFLTTLDLSAALQEKSRLEAQKAKLAEFERLEYQRKMKEAADMLAAYKESATTTPEVQYEVKKTTDDLGVIHTTIVQAEEVKPAPVEVEMEVLDFRVWVTLEQKQLLREFFLKTKIKIGKVN